VALVDRRTNSVVLRIVYDGPPEAGKATNLKLLCERLSLRQPIADPAQERGLYLDWLDATGESIGGPRVRCQLVNVPRQLQFARRGRAILDSADAVVFIADSRASAAPRTKAALRSLVRGLGNRPDVPLVLQANKQDLPGAQPPSDLHQALGLAARVPVIAAQASGGAGVVETFSLAVRVAVDHVRARLVAGELGEGDATNGNEPLLALDAIPEIFEELDAIASAAHAATRHTQTRPSIDPASPNPAPDPEDIPAPDRVATRKGVAAPARVTVIEPIAAPAPVAPAATALGLDIDLAQWDRTPTETDLPPASDSEPTYDALPVTACAYGSPGSIEEAVSMIEIIELGTTAGDIAAAGHPTFLPLGTPGPPDPPPLQLPTFDLPAGLVWPGVSGRNALASLAPPVRTTTVPASWGPGQAIELACGERWLAHTAPNLWFADLDDGRRALLDAIRWQAGMAALTPPGRTYALSPQSDGARLWILTPVHTTVWVAIEEAFSRGDRATAGWLARRGLEAVDEIRAHGVVIGDLDHIAVDDRPRLLTTPWTPRSERLAAQLQRLFTEAVL
jgi:signal recognition particle receptor subunit beta